MGSRADSCFHRARLSPSVIPAPRSCCLVFAATTDETTRLKNFGNFGRCEIVSNDFPVLRCRWIVPLVVPFVLRPQQDQ